MNLRLIIVAVVGVVIAAVFVGLTIIGPMLFGGEEVAAVEGEAMPEPTEAVSDEAAAPRRAAKAAEKSTDIDMGVYEVGPIVEVAERVVNLSGEGPFSVLQVTIVLEFAATEEIALATVEEKPALVELFKAEVAPVSALIEDGVNALISTKSGEGLLTVAGKDELKQEIMEVANTFTPHPVIAVYFTKFFLQ